MKGLNVAVIGAGIAGLSAAIFLKRSDHAITLYECFDAAKPVGAGVVLQPSGLAVLGKLGLDKAAIAVASPIHHVFGRECLHGRVMFDATYADLSPQLFALGMHRNTLFSLLYEEVKKLGIPIITSTKITDLHYDSDQRPRPSDGSISYDGYDLIVDAQGTRSHLRDKFSFIKLNQLHPHTGFWGVCKDTEGSFAGAYNQRCMKAHHTICVFPIGKLNDDDCESISFFWSLPTRDLPQWRANGLEAWQHHIISLWPEAEPLVMQFHSLDDLTVANHSDIILRQWHGNRLVFIGDSAHSLSPQLAQGVTMALLDSLALDFCLQEANDIQVALRNYSKKRKAHIRFYQWASRIVTPYFQSDSSILPILRDWTLGMWCKTPYVKTHMLLSLIGAKTGIFTHFNPGDIHPDYDIRKH